MEDVHAAALSAVISSLQGFCRGPNATSRQRCRREIHEKVVMEEISRSDDPEYFHWRKANSKKLEACFEECRATGKTEVKTCNGECLSTVVQGIWKRTNVPEYEAVIGKYAE